MSTMAQTGGPGKDNHRLLAYMQHMAQTARCDSAKRLFRAFAQQEKRRIEASGGYPFTAPGHRLGGTQSGSRLEGMKDMLQKSEPTRGEAMKSSTGKSGKRVSFQVTVDPGSDVFVAGSFNNWNPTQYRMKDNPGSGHCKKTLVLPAGRHEYKFVINGQWRVDPNCPDSVPNGSGSTNSVLTV